MKSTWGPRASMVRLVLVAGMLSALVLAHEGHDVPGALPPPQHGGRVKEAGDLNEGGREAYGKKEGEQGHDEKSEAKGSHDEKELFVEVVYKDKTLRLYPLMMDPKDASSFVAMPLTEVKLESLKVEHPRTKHFDTLVTRNVGEGIESAFDSKNAHRFIVHALFTFNNEKKIAKIQIEGEG